uniref:Nucleoprotein n=1 Tax=Ophrys virus 1 TaxID=2977977 RepID=A0A9N7AAM9_9RHAB|nr:TPA_asm: nucleocapsid protein [Ophrys virus 1]
MTTAREDLHDLPAVRSARDQLLQFRASQVAENDYTHLPLQPEVYHGTIPTDAYRRIDIGTRDLLQEKLDAYDQEDLQITEISAEFAAVTSITSDTRVSRHDFPDDVFISERAIEAYYSVDEEVARVGRLVMPMYSSGFSKRGAAYLFFLAHHTKVPNSDYKEFLFPDMNLLFSLNDIQYTHYSEEYMAIDNFIGTLEPYKDPKLEAAYYSFIATCTFRLFTKSPGNFLLAWGHILDGFGKFYGEKPNINIPSPSENAVASLSNFLTADDKMRMSLYRLLYKANESDRHKGLKNYMYDIHLSNTGLHIVSIFADLVKALNCSPALVLTALKSPMYSAQLNGLVKFIQLMSNDDEKHKRRMWRYGRLFDEDFMAELQTKRCPIFVYVLAYALQLEAPSTHKDILKIAQLKDVSADNQRKAKKVSEKLLRMVKYYLTARGEANVFKILAS